MLGHGFYNKHSHAQGAANTYGLPLIARAVGALDAAAVGGALRLADYGSAQGHNSLLPMGAAIEALRARQATHWLSRKPGDLPDQIWSARATGAARAAWAAQARADWYAFLGHRAVELVPSGRVVMVNSGAEAQANSGAEGLADLANETLQALVVKDLFAQRLEAALATDPGRYSARWVLQLMLVSKASSA